MSKITLIKNIENCRDLLINTGETIWSKKMDNILKRKFDLNSCIEILSWYGGMGSLNDLILDEGNAPKLKKKDEEWINKKLESFFEMIYNEVKRIKKDIEKFEDEKN